MVRKKKREKVLLLAIFAHCAIKSFGWNFACILAVDYDFELTGDSNWKTKERIADRIPVRVEWCWPIFLLPSVSCVCVELQPLLKG